MIPIKQFGKEYKPNRGKSSFTINGGKTRIQITHLEKSKACQLYWYCFALFDNQWIAFDIRHLPDFKLQEYEEVHYWLYRREFVREYFQNRNIEDLESFHALLTADSSNSKK